MQIHGKGSMQLTIETSLRDVAHRVLDRPDDTVHEQLVLRRRYRQQCYALLLAIVISQ